MDPDVPLEEERKRDYDPKHFHSVKFGELGYGASSTVWLAKDTCCLFWLSMCYVVLKICNNDYDNRVSASHELHISNHIATANPSHPGRQFVRTVIDLFTAKGWHRTHMCLVFEPLWEPIRLLQQHFNDGCYPSAVLKFALRYILSGLDYLHSECQVINTVPSLINIAKTEVAKPSPRKVLHDWIIYFSRNNFGHPIFRHCDVFYTTVFNLTPYRSLEVILGAPWTYGTDIWNLGVMNLLDEKTLCNGLNLDSRMYSSGVFKCQSFISQDVTLVDIVTTLGGKDKRLFLGFVGKMLQWLPENRSTAKELLAHPWLHWFP
ncbi:hypothetical protein PILCRDRAFT_99152 [Piloderma croceum F 1598]|uniref:non-specific serine/threonine protein kinase n=1 Tax=Piloderma croceum (strain F 1598) TaxID=765440 RepID=A0A0C3F326_PILCF|nr:hypothetical protein PILCRDRAFT_99152 [Piloderma croceum F 1598]